MNPPPNSTFPNPLCDVWIALIENTLLLVLGASRSQLMAYFPRIPAVLFFTYHGTLPSSNPTNLIILLGPGFYHISRSIQSSVPGLVARLPSLTTIDARIHESIWSKRFADHLSPLPSSIQKATISVSDFRVDGTELFRAAFDASASPFTTSFSATFPGLNIGFKGLLADLRFMLGLHRALAAVSFTGGSLVKVDIDNNRLMALDMSGRMSDAQKFLNVLRVGTASRLISLSFGHQNRTYRSNSVSIAVRNLDTPDEFGRFLKEVVYAAPGLKSLNIHVAELSVNEATPWTDGIRALGDLRELVRVSITHPRPLMLLDADIARFLSSWTCAEHISLNPKPSHAFPHVQRVLTTNALEGITQRFPHSLRYLGLYLNADEAPVVGFSGVTPQRGLAVLELGIQSSNYQRAQEVVRMAQTLFPDARVAQV
ncbi:hypothetical protein GYMLUDRAFT_773955 [Collybiopsis luxurians FD-317 M1]|uniref:Uncharacterized protein n=1 Tax=Collybiopsis luxurians FD-317 M1 TaxID=944289 RepID=A0A0D0CG41_9AGAR|nr:hypothetical protein GYMLUDRAFT_773955 [Collybiopsis luxurians FD-317 M1]